MITEYRNPHRQLGILAAKIYLLKKGGQKTYTNINTFSLVIMTVFGFTIGALITLIIHYTFFH